MRIFRRLPGVLPASDVEEPPDDSRARTDAGAVLEKLATIQMVEVWIPMRRTLADVAAPHPAGAGRAGITQADPHHAAFSTTAANQGLSDRVKTRLPLPRFVVKTFA